MGRFVLIGGGENGREGTIYETEKIDEEIVKGTKKEHPNFLFLAHGNNYEKSYYEIMQKIYTNRFGCVCNSLLKEELNDKNVTEDKIKWADIIYIGGGNTLNMMNKWRKVGFIDILKKYINTPKTFCGISAGAICWCKSGLSDSRVSAIKPNNYIIVSGMGLIDIVLCPSYDENKQESLEKKMTKIYKTPAIAFEKGTAIIIENGKYKAVRSLENKKIYKCFYKKKEYLETEIKITESLNNLESLIQKI